MQFAALARLAEAGAQSQNALGRQTAMDAATIKGVIDRLGRRGLVTTAPDAQDRRRTTVALSDRGAQLVAGLLETARRVSDETLTPLDAQERETFLALLKKLT